ncbi:MAG: hypothetical protein JKY37_01485, partial [Nannocystaceae bacterium]|nr:hypothetical protein [Nannocystaceae bacterium]
MASLRTSAVLLAALHTWGCQRVPDDNGPATSAGEDDPTGDPAAGTFLPQDDDAANESDGDDGDDGGDDG